MTRKSGESWPPAQKEASGRICELNSDFGGRGEIKLKCYSNKIGNTSTSEDLFNYWPEEDRLDDELWSYTKFLKSIFARLSLITSDLISDRVFWRNCHSWCYFLFLLTTPPPPPHLIFLLFFAVQIYKKTNYSQISDISTDSCVWNRIQMPVLSAALLESNLMDWRKEDTQPKINP